MFFVIRGKNWNVNRKRLPFFGPLLICNDKTNPFSWGLEQVCVTSKGSNYLVASTTCWGPTKTWTQSRQTGNACIRFSQLWLRLSTGVFSSISYKEN
jgi:hypothetical protein